MNHSILRPVHSRLEERVHMGQGLCYATDGWLAALKLAASAEDEPGEMGNYDPENRLCEPVPVVAA